ncbi:hypothetical protein TcasGA2_TC035022, partial [Tribolium castaneum]
EEANRAISMIEGGRLQAEVAHHFNGLWQRDQEVDVHDCSTWEYLGALSFLEPHIKPQKILGNVINKKINSEAEILPCPSMTEFSTSSIPSTSQQDLDGFGGKETPSASSITPSFVPETPRQRETSRGKKNADMRSRPKLPHKTVPTKRTFDAIGDRTKIRKPKRVPLIRIPPPAELTPTDTSDAQANRIGTGNGEFQRPVPIASVEEDG